LNGSQTSQDRHLMEVGEDLGLRLQQTEVTLMDESSLVSHFLRVLNLNLASNMHDGEWTIRDLVVPLMIIR
jgi:hypothetical protein